MYFLLFFTHIVCTQCTIIIYKTIAQRPNKKLRCEKAQRSFSINFAGLIGKLILLYKEILTVYFRMLEVETYFKWNLSIIGLGNATHCTVGCAELVDVSVVLPLDLGISAALESEHMAFGSVEDVVFYNKVCGINDSSGTDVCDNRLVGTCNAEARTCESAKVILIADVYKVSC